MRISVLLELCGSALASVDMQPYNKAIKENPKDFMAYYKRATAHLAQNNDAQALRDFSKTIELNPSFEPGLFYYSRTSMRRGNTETAKQALERPELSGRCTELLESCKEYDQLGAAALQDLAGSEWGDCVTEATQALSIAPKSLEMLRARYQCYMGAGDSAHAFADLMDIVSNDKGDAQAVSKLARFEFLINDHRDKALQLLRRCVNFDPEAKQCSSTSKQLRNLQKQLKGPKIQYKKLLREISSEIQSLGLGEEDAEKSVLVDGIRRMQCEGYLKREKWAEGAEVCARARDVDPDFIPAILLQAQLERQNNNLDEALRLLRDQINAGNQDPRIHELYNEVMAERHQQHYGRRGGQGSGSQGAGKDLYKILGVEKSATKKEIKKAYRELSKKYHPDKYRGSDLTKDQIMEKMQEINEAHEILADENSRQDYDAERARTGGGGGRGDGFPGGFSGGAPRGFPGGGGPPRGAPRGFPGGFHGGFRKSADMNDLLRKFMRQE